MKSRQKTPQTSAASRLAYARKNLLRNRSASRGLGSEAEGLLAALDQLAMRISGTYRVDCRFECMQRLQIHDDFAATHLYCMAQECAMNAVNRGYANQILIRLERKGTDLQLSVIDNGRIFNEAAVQQDSGLSAIGHLAQVIGGSLCIRPRPRTGTCVSWSLPYASVSKAPKPEKAKSCNGKSARADSSLLAMHQREFYRTILDAIPSSIFVVANDVRIVDYNSTAAKLLGDEPRLVLHKRAGDVFRCVHSAEDPKGCGYAAGCRDCVVRNAVSRSLQGHRIVRQESNMELITHEQSKHVSYLVTTAPFEHLKHRLVLLILEDLSELLSLHAKWLPCAGCDKLRLVNVRPASGDVGGRVSG